MPKHNLLWKKKIFVAFSYISSQYILIYFTPKIETYKKEKCDVFFVRTGFSTDVKVIKYKYVEVREEKGRKNNLS